MTVIKNDTALLAGNIVQVLTIMEPVTSCKEALAYVIDTISGAHTICPISDLTGITNTDVEPV